MESHTRSIVKGLTWRALAMADTVLLAFIFTGSIGAALSIGGIELLTKVAWYYAHERLWVRLPGGVPSLPWTAYLLEHSTKMRSVTKALSWRIVGALDTFVIALIITGKVGVSGAIGGTEAITKVILYYLHDRAWSHVHWGTAHTEDTSEHSASRAKALVWIIRTYHRRAKALAYAAFSVAFVGLSALLVFGLTRGL